MENKSAIDIIAIIIFLIIMLSLFVYGKVIKRKKPMPKSHFNYRIATRTGISPIGRYREYLIITCYYRNGVADSYGISDIGFYEDIDSMKKSFSKIQRCLNEPILDLNNFPNPYLNKD